MKNRPQGANLRAGQPFPEGLTARKRVTLAWEDSLDPRILEAARAIELSLSEEVTITDIAAAVGMSLYHFHRLFVRETGEQPAAYLRRLRLDAAALRLQWGNESTAEIAQVYCYDSRSAFSRAFRSRFGAPPAKYRDLHRSGSRDSARESVQRVSLHELEGFRLLAKRYVGDPFQLSSFWADFTSLLPAGLRAGKPLYIGQMHDDFRITERNQVRYDCGITVSEQFIADERLIAAGLRLIDTHAGRYGGIEHRGPAATVPETYEILQRQWFHPQGLVVGNEPAIELHPVVRHEQDREDLSFTILIPVGL